MYFYLDFFFIKISRIVCIEYKIFNDKKRKYFSVITKNSTWEILTKNFVTFKRWDGVKDEKC